MGKFTVFGKMRDTLAVWGSVLICSAALILPYRLREFFIFLLHFVLNGILVKLKLLSGWIAAVLGFVFFLPIYYLGVPLTLALRKFFLYSCPGFEHAGRPLDDNGIYRMF